MKHFNHKDIQIFLIGVLLLSSCQKDTLKPNTGASKSFPNKVGNYWEYEVYDSTTNYPSGGNKSVSTSDKISLVSAISISFGFISPPKALPEIIIDMYPVCSIDYFQN